MDGSSRRCGDRLAALPGPEDRQQKGGSAVRVSRLPIRWYRVQNIVVMSSHPARQAGE
jgi:hypothetical protein